MHEGKQEDYNIYNNNPQKMGKTSDTKGRLSQPLVWRNPLVASIAIVR
jgi:hypothetical protein